MRENGRIETAPHGSGWFSRLFVWLFRRSDHRTIEGIRVAVFGSTSADPGDMFTKLSGALRLVYQHDPRAIEVLRAQSAGIWVFGTAGGYAEWHPKERLVVMQPEHVSNSTTSTVRLASTLVHEATHAWLQRFGARYTPERRARIESICFKRQLRFVQRIPGESELTAELERQLTRDPAYLSDEALKQRAAAELERLGLPATLVASMADLASRWLRLTRSCRRTWLSPKGKPE